VQALEPVFKKAGLAGKIELVLAEMTHLVFRLSPAGKAAAPEKGACAASGAVDMPAINFGPQTSAPCPPPTRPGMAPRCRTPASRGRARSAGSGCAPP
jgi:hypothetical protein